MLTKTGGDLDIAGANAANWFSILVRTGVYSADQGPPTHTPHYHAENVGEAVWWAIEREYRRVSAIKVREDILGEMHST